MTLAMTLGMSVGVRRTLWMMLGEVFGVALVAIAALVGVASIMLNYPAASQGFITAIANPKGWAFMVSLLPPFISLSKPLTGQLMVLVGLIMLSEFVCMLIYATGGKSLRMFLNRNDNIRWMNRIAGSLLICVGVWLALV